MMQAWADYLDDLRAVPDQQPSTTALPGLVNEADPFVATA
jgi:hypothetical protein